MKKKIIIFGGICLVFIALYMLYLHIGKKEQTPQVFREIYSLERDEGRYFHININYPQLEKNKNVDTEKANELLKDAAFSIRGKTADAAIALLEEEVEDLDCFTTFEVDYEVLWLDKGYISIVYRITSYTGGPSYTHHYMTTVDISTGKYIELDDVIGIDQLVQTLRAGIFEVYTGTYSEFRDEDAHKPEEIENFVQAFKENLALEKAESGFNRFSSRNIGLDNKNIYIYFPYNNSLDGYFILRVPLEADVIADELASAEAFDEVEKSNETKAYDEVEESEETKAFDEMEESEETKVSDEMEEPKEAEGAARVFDSWMDFSGTSFSEDLGLPYADDETFEMIKTAYEQVDFFGEFELGNQDVYDEYKEKYKELLENDGLVFEPEKGVSVPFSQIDDIAYHIENYGLQKFVYYFFDIDGDELPELSVHIYGYGIFVLDYNPKKDTYSVWYPMGNYWYSIIGTKKVQWMGNGKYLASYLLDESGKEACETFFFYDRYSEDVDLAIVMLPVYAEEEKNMELPETMKSQGIYTRLRGRWYFRITKEQYDELAKPYKEAYDMAHEKIDEVTYTYEELFGEM